MTSVLLSLNADEKIPSDDSALIDHRDGRGNTNVKTMNELQLRSREAAELCHHDVSAMVADARESFEIWRSLFYMGDSGKAKEWMNLQWFNPFLSVTENAHMSMVIINLFILGDEPHEKVHSVYFLRRKLSGCGLLSSTRHQGWDHLLAEAKPVHDKLKFVRDKHLAHRDKDYTWQKAMQESGLSPEDLDRLITVYFWVASDAAELLELPFFGEQIILGGISESIADVRTALLQYQPRMQAAEDERVRRELL